MPLQIKHSKIVISYKKQNSSRRCWL